MDLLRKKEEINNKHSFLENVVRYCFFVCVVVLYVFGLDTRWYRLANLTVLVFGFAVFLYVLYRNKIAVGKSLAVASVMFLYMHLSCFWAYDMSASISQMRTQTLTFLLFLVVYEANMMIDGLVKLYVNALYIAGYVMAFYSLYVYDGLGNMTAIMLDGERIGEEISMANTYGLVFSEAFLAAFYRLLYYGKKESIIGLIVFPFFAFSSGSKKAFAFIFIGLVVLLVFKFGIKKLYKSFFGIAIMLVVAYFVLQLPMFETIMLRIEEMFEGSSVSDNIRSRMISEGWQMITTQNTFFGFGIDNFRKITNFTVYSHNNYIETLFSFGFVGAVLYYFQYILAAVGGYMNSKHQKEYMLLFLILLITVVMDWAQVSMYSKEIWIVLGMLLAANDKLEKPALTVGNNLTNR